MRLEEKVVDAEITDKKFSSRKSSMGITIEDYSLTYKVSDGGIYGEVYGHRSVRPEVYQGLNHGDKIQVEIYSYDGRMWHSNWIVAEEAMKAKSKANEASRNGSKPHHHKEGHKEAHKEHKEAKCLAN